MPDVLVILRTLAISLVGGFAANFVGLPAGWLSGGMVAVTVAALAGLPVRVHPRLTDTVFVILGVLLGTGVTPEIVHRIHTWPLTLAILVVSVLVLVVACQIFLVRVAKWDRPTAFFASLPGALSYVLAVASTTTADLRRVVLSQSVRLFLLVAATPALVSALEETPPRLVAPTPGILTLVALFAAAIVSSLAFQRLGMPAGLLFGAMVVSGIAHGTGLVTGGLPSELTIAAYVVLGGMIGSRFMGTSLAFLRSVAFASVGAFLVAAALSVLSAIAAAALVDQPTTALLVAFAPGGLDAMIALALALHLDSAFVAAHQLARFIAIAIAVPLVVRTRWFGGLPPAIKDERD